MAKKLTKSKVDAFNAAIGKFTIAWTTMEAWLDVLATVLCEPGAKPPHQLSKKTKLARRLLPEHLTEEHARDAVLTIKSIEVFSETRHDYIHGAILSHSFEGHKLKVELGRFLQPTKEPRPTVKVDAAWIDAKADEVFELGDELRNIMYILLVGVPYDECEQD